MKKLILMVLIATAARCAAAGGVEVFRSGLQAFQTNGPEALLRTWYSADDQAGMADVRRRLAEVSEKLGDVVEVEVFAPKKIGKHIERLYGAIYFRNHPLWLRAEYYSIDGRSGFLSLEFSKTADDILPLEIQVAQ